MSETSPSPLGEMLPGLPPTPAGECVPALPENGMLATGVGPPPSGPGRIGPCALGQACTAKDQELSDQYRCQHCGKQLHGFISGCSQAKNPKYFRDGVICKNQPCVDGAAVPVLKPQGRPDGAAIAAAAGLPKFLWETQQPKRKRDPHAPKLRRQRYTKQHKETVLQTLHSTPGAKLPEIAKQFGIPEGTLRGWFDDERRKKAAEKAANEAAGLIVGDDIGDINEQILGPPEGTSESHTDPPLQEPHTDQPETAPSPPKKKRRQRYSNETKIQVILALETRPNTSLNDVAKEFNVAAGTVRGWREEADKIQKQAMENRRVGAKANPSRDPLRKVWDAILALFEKNSRLPIQQRLEVNVAVVRTIGKQARDALLRTHQATVEANEPPLLTPTEVANMEKFKASETWARKWARDHQVISAKPETGSQVEAAQNQVAFLQKIISNYPPDRVYTMTSTALFFRILPHRTYVSKLPNSQKRVRACKGLKSKDRLTLYLCTNETGSEKLPISCIGKYERPACFQVAAQKQLPYLYQKQALSDAGTFQRWWRTVFLPHVRQRVGEGGKCLLLVEDYGPCKAGLLKDPTGQVQVEALPPSPSNTMAFGAAKDHSASGSGHQGSSSSSTTQPVLPQCQALQYGILETIKRRYRYRLLQEVMEAFDERNMRRQVANNAKFPRGSQGLREGNLSNISDTMRLLEAIWKEVAQTTIAKSWQRTKLRPKSKDDPPALPPGQRAKSEKRQTTREKKQLIKDLHAFLKRYESKDFSKDENSNQLEEMVEKLKNCFLYTDGEVIEAKEMMDSLEEWIGLEESQGMIALFMEEIKQEMNIEYLVGIKEPLEGAVQEAQKGEDAQLPKPVEPSDSGSGSATKSGSRDNQNKETELDLETAIELATTIKSTACKLFQHGDILGELAVRLDDASDSIFLLLRKQKEQAEAKREAEKAKAIAKSKLAARAAAAAAATVAAATTVTTGVPEVTIAMEPITTEEAIPLPPADDVTADIDNVDLHVAMDIADV